MEVVETLMRWMALDMVAHCALDRPDTKSRYACVPPRGTRSWEPSVSLECGRALFCFVWVHASCFDYSFKCTLARRASSMVVGLGN